MSSQAPLETQQVVVKLGKLDQKTSDKLAIPGTLAVAQDVQMTMTGRYERRTGSTYVDTVAGAIRVHGGERETLVGTQDTLYSDVDGVFQARGSIAGYRGDFEPINPTAFAQTSHDMCRVNGLDFSVWQEAGGIFYAVRDSATGAYLVSEGTITTTAFRTCPSIIAVGTLVLVLYQDTGTATIFGRRIDSATPGVVGGEVAVSAYSPTIGSGYDSAVKPGSATTVMVASYIQSGTNRVKLVEWNVSTMALANTLTVNLALTSAGVQAAIAIMRGVSPGYVVLCGIADNGVNGSFIEAFTATAGLGASGAVVNVFNGSGGTTHTITQCAGFVDGAGTWHMLIDAKLTTASSRSQVWYFTRTSGGALAGPGILFGFRLMSPTFSFGGRDVVLYSGTVQTIAGPDSTLFLGVVQTGAIVGRVLAGLADETPVDPSGTARPGLPHATVLASQVLLPSVYFQTTTERSAAVVSFDLQPSARYLEVAGVTLIPGSTIYLYDGIGVSELGFHFPPGVTAVVTAAAGGLQVGDYYYRAAWEWVDARGRLHRSKPSDPVKLTSAGAGLRGRVTIGTLVTTLKSSPIPQASLALFRTTINPSSNSAAAYFRAATVANDPTTASLIIDDTLTDAQLVVNDRLYTLGNSRFSNSSPPPANGLCAWGGRVWAWERDILWPSNPIEDGFGVEFPVENSLQVSDDRGDIVVAADSGQRLAAFKRTAIYVVSGDGPGATGVGSFSPIRRLPAPLGARSAVSVVSTELGVFFQDDASGHIWLLPPEGDPEPIGREIEALAASLTITDAVVVSDKRQVRFYSSQGTTLVYDMTHQQWLTHTVQPALSAAIVDGVCTYITAVNVSLSVTAGDVREDDPTQWREGASGPGAAQTYAAILETDWLSLNQLAGYMRVFAIQAIGVKNGDHTAVLVLTYRLGNTTDVKFLSSSGLVTSFGYRIEGRPHIKHQQATAIKIRLTDGAPSGPSWGIEAFSLTVGTRGKRSRLPKSHLMTP